MYTSPGPVKCTMRPSPLAIDDMTDPVAMPTQYFIPAVHATRWPLSTDMVAAPRSL